MAKFNLVDKQGLDILTAFMVKVATTAEDNSSAVVMTQDALSKLSEGVVAALEEVEAVLTKIDEEKADKPVTMSATVDATAWTSSATNPNFPFQCTISSELITAASKVTVYLTPGVSTGDATVSPVCKIEAGAVTIYATAAIPSMELRLWIEPGSNPNNDAYTCGSVIMNKAQADVSFEDDATVTDALNQIYNPSSESAS